MRTAGKKPKIYRTHSAEIKQAAVKMATEIGTTKAAKHFMVNPSLISKWRSRLEDKNIILASGKIDQMFSMPMSNSARNHLAITLDKLDRFEYVKSEILKLAEYLKDSESK